MCTAMLKAVDNTNQTMTPDLTEKEGMSNDLSQEKRTQAKHKIHGCRQKHGNTNNHQG